MASTGRHKTLGYWHFQKDFDTGDIERQMVPQKAVELVNIAARHRYTRAYVGRCSTPFAHGIDIFENRLRGAAGIALMLELAQAPPAAALQQDLRNDDCEQLCASKLATIYSTAAIRRHSVER